MNARLYGLRLSLQWAKVPLDTPTVQHAYLNVISVAKTRVFVQRLSLYERGADRIERWQFRSLTKLGTEINGRAIQVAKQ
jgi:hypothetical protein